MRVRTTETTRMRIEDDEEDEDEDEEEEEEEEEDGDDDEDQEVLLWSGRVLPWPLYAVAVPDSYRVQDVVHVHVDVVERRLIRLLVTGHLGESAREGPA